MKTTTFDVEGGRGVRAECGCQVVLGEFTACSEHEFDIGESLRIRSVLLPLAEHEQTEWGKGWLDRLARAPDKPKDDAPFVPIVEPEDE